LGNDALINETNLIFLYFLFKIRNILTGCYTLGRHCWFLSLSKESLDPTYAVLIRNLCWDENAFGFKSLDFLGILKQQISLVSNH